MSGIALAWGPDSRSLVERMVLTQDFLGSPSYYTIDDLCVAVQVKEPPKRIKPHIRCDSENLLCVVAGSDKTSAGFEQSIGISPSSLSKLGSLPSSTQIATYYATTETNCFRYIDCDFISLIYDKAQCKVYAARDIFGHHTLYYAVGRDIFICASNISPILATGMIDNKLDLGYLYRFLLKGRSQEGHRTTISEIKSVPPGSVVSFDKKRIDVSWHWVPPEPDPNSQNDIESYAKGFANLLRESTAHTLKEKKSVCVLLSGGKDSTVVGALAAEYRDRAQFHSDWLQGATMTFTTQGKWNEKARVSSVSDMHHIPVIYYNAEKYEQGPYFLEGTNEMIPCWDDPMRPFYPHLQFDFYEFLKKNNVTNTIDGIGEIPMHPFKVTSWLIRNCLKAVGLKLAMCYLRESWNGSQKYRKTIRSVQDILEGTCKVIIGRGPSWLQSTGLRVPWVKNFKGLNDTEVFFDNGKNTLGGLRALQAILETVPLADRVALSFGIRSSHPLRTRSIVDYLYKIPLEMLPKQKGILLKAFTEHIPDNIIHDPKMVYGYRRHMARNWMEIRSFLKNPISEDLGLIDNYILQTTMDQVESGRIQLDSFHQQIRPILYLEEWLRTRPIWST